jgi:hypothetical protein
MAGPPAGGSQKITGYWKYGNRIRPEPLPVPLQAGGKQTVSVFCVLARPNRRPQMCRRCDTFVVGKKAAGAELVAAWKTG